MPDNGTYLLTNVGFSSSEEPLLLFQDHDEFIDMKPLGNLLTLRFDTRQRYCTGWRDISTGERFTCPDNQSVDTKYEQCSACQKRTGFNPAFYHATTVSTQQEARNQEPHILYLAHFGPGVIKVGISLAARGNSRLLEQGARTALLLGVFPTAHIARQYEAQIAAITGIVETVQQRKKTDLLTASYDKDTGTVELLAAKAKIEAITGIQFDDTACIHFDNIYFPDNPPELADAHDVSNQRLISGRVVGMLGSVLFCQYGDSLLYLPLKKYVGYKVEINNTVIPITISPRQTSLF